MNNIKPLVWRKGLVLSTTFLFSLFLSVSCKKKVNSVGQNTIEQNELLSSSGVDTFSITTYTISDNLDSLVTSNAVYGVLGSYSDPVFGPANAQIYTQVRLKAFSPNFYPSVDDTITIDSVVLGLEYAGLEYADYYGLTGIQKVEVYEITDNVGLIDTVDYFMGSQLLTNQRSFVAAGMANLNLNPSTPTFIDTTEMDPQLRIHLDTSFGRRIIDQSVNYPGDFSSQEAFTTFFKGFKIQVNNGIQLPGQGGLFYFDLNDVDSEVTIYYKLNGESKRYSLVINSSCPKFNAMSIDRTFTDIETVLNDSTQGQNQYYAQAFGTRARIHVPGLENIPKNAIIHKATLRLPVAHQTGTKYSPAEDIAVTTPLIGGGYSFYNFSAYDSYNKQYEIDLRSYAQAVVNEQVENTGLALSPVLYITSGDRIIFNGSNSMNKSKPSLNIVYTEF